MARFPYTNLHDMNLNWIVNRVKEAFSPANPPPYPVRSVNGQTGDVVIDTTHPVESVNSKTGVVTLYGSDIEMSSGDSTKVDNAINAKYTKPAGGIPATDIAPGVIPSIPASYQDLIDEVNDLEADLDANTNVTAGTSEVTLANGSQNYSSVLITWADTGIVTVNGTPSANASAFISNAQTLPAGEYIITDGYDTHDGSFYVAVFTNTTIARSDTQPVFTLSASTSVRLIMWVKQGVVFNNKVFTPILANTIALSNEKLTSLTKGLIGYETNTIEKALTYGFKPWAVPAPQVASQLNFYNAVKNIRLYGGKTGEKYFIKQCMYNSSAFTPKTTYITLYRNSDNVKVCEYYSNIPPTGRTTVLFRECNNSGITASLDVDFSLITDNSTMQMADADTLLINNDCIIINPAVNILIPNTIYGVVGVETNIYWDNAIQCSNIDDVIVQVNGGSGVNLGSCWRYKPTSAGSFTFTVYVRDKNYRVLAQKTITFTATVKAVDSATTINAILIGDSMFDNQYHIPALTADFTSTNITFNVLGTRTYSEGRGGWTSTQYVSVASAGGVSNPFYNPNTQTFDFSYYMTNQGYSNIDFVFIALGTNDARGVSNFTDYQNASLVPVKNLKTMIDSIIAYDPSITIGLCLPAIGAKMQYPFAINNSTYQPESLFKAVIQLQNANIESVFTNYGNVFIVPMGLSIDNEYGYPTSSVAVSDRITSTITVQSDPYHPTSEGYGQFADCEFCFIRNNLN